MTCNTLPIWTVSRQNFMYLFVCRLRSGGIQKHLLTETEPLMLKKVLEVPVTVEAT